MEGFCLTKLDSPSAKGSGEKVTVIAQSNASSDTIVFDGQFNHIRDLSFRPSVFRTGGYALKFNTGQFGGGANDIFIEYDYNGIYCLSCTSVELFAIELRYLTGIYGIYYAGSVSEAASKLVVRDAIGDNPWPNGSPTFSQMKGNIANTTAYSLHDIVISSGWLWQCTTAGTTSG